MSFELDNNKDIDLLQEFLPMHISDVVEAIHRFNIYKATPNLLFFDENINYYAILDEETSERALLGIKWILNGKILELKTKLLIGEGDEEMFQLILEELVERLSQKKIADMKNSDKTTIISEGNESQ